jgi:hypothetical protein
MVSIVTHSTPITAHFIGQGKEASLSIHNRRQTMCTSIKLVVYGMGHLLVVKSGVLWKIITGGSLAVAPTMLEQEQKHHTNTNA